MNLTVKLTAMVLTIGMLIACTACSNKKPVKVVQNINQQPSNKKPIYSESDGQENLSHDYSEDITATLNDDHLLIKTPDESYSIPYNKIEEFTYMTDWNYAADEVIEGEDGEYEVYGKVRTEADEEYYLFIYKTTPVYIAVYFAGMQYVFNLDSTTATKTLYEQLKEKV